MVQAYGYGGLSFRDIAAEVMIRSASIHHHFPTKADLGLALANRCWTDARMQLYALWEQNPDPVTCLTLYPGLFRRDLEDGNRMSLWGFMAAEHDDLPRKVRGEVSLFADVHVVWLGDVLLASNPAADQAATGRRARAIFAAVQGAQLLARERADVAVFDDIIQGYRELGVFDV